MKQQQLAERAPESSGPVLGRGLRVMETRGRGSQSVVYAVWNEEEWTAMACKVLLPPWDRDPRAIEQLLREGERLASLAHPGIVRVFEVNCASDPAYLLMELLDGPDLGALLERRGPLSVRAAARLAVEVGGALAHLHRQGLLHLDLKPRNIVLHQGHAKLVDLGIARTVGRRPEPGRVSGTAAYMAPEQRDGGRPLTPATDIYALGLVLFEALTGARAFPIRRESGAAIMDLFPLAALRALPLREVRPRTPKAVADLVAACLEPHPADRPDSLDDVLAELAPFAALPNGAAAQSPALQAARRTA